MEGNLPRQIDAITAQQEELFLALAQIEQELLTTTL
jgi:hypothetical protein